MGQPEACVSRVSTQLHPCSTAPHMLPVRHSPAPHMLPVRHSPAPHMLAVRHSPAPTIRRHQRDGPVDVKGGQVGALVEVAVVQDHLRVVGGLRVACGRSGRSAVTSNDQQPGARGDTGAAPSTQSPIHHCRGGQAGRQAGRRAGGLPPHPPYGLSLLPIIRSSLSLIFSGGLPAR